MFIRKKQKTDPKTKKKYDQYQLIESERTEKGPRQRILLNLGTDLLLSASDRKLLANRIAEISNGVQTFLLHPDHIEQLAHRLAKQLVQKHSQPPAQEKKQEKFESVDISTLKMENARSIGIEHISFEAIRQLGLGQYLTDLGFSKRQAALAIGVITARLAGCCSDKASFEWLQNISAIDELLETDFSHLAPKSVYAIADRLLRRKDDIESFLAKREEDLFSLDNTLLFYDLTNTYFEGSANNIDKAKKGRSKEKRNDRPLVTLGLKLNSLGFPLASSIFPGNVSEPSTLKQAITKLEEKEKKRPVIVLDAGIATKENLSWLRSNNYPYIVCVRRKREPITPDLDYEIVCEKQGNLVKAARVEEESSEIKIICHSLFKENKEQEWKKLTKQRFEAVLEKLAEGLGRKGRMKSYRKVVEKIGRLKQKYSRLSQYYTIDLTLDSDKKNVTAIHWTFDEGKSEQKLNGHYTLRVHGINVSTQKLWDMYIMLTRVEEAFRCLKGELGMRPIYHRKDKRLDGHLFLTVLAYHVLQTIQHQLTKKSVHYRWETLRKRLQTQVRVTTTLFNDKQQKLHIRATTNPEPFHKRIYTTLGVSHKPGHTLKTVL